MTLEKRGSGRSEGGSSVVPAAGLLAGLGALAGASCCALPLVLAIFGIGGAWVANLGLLVAYRPHILAVAVLVVCAGWVVTLRRRSPRRAQVMLAVATAAVLGGFAITAYEQPVTRYLAAVWRAS